MEPAAGPERRVNVAAEELESAGLRRFGTYPEYEDSGVEWLGVVPAHWGVMRLKFVAPACVSKLDTKPDDATYVGLEHIESWTGRMLLDSQPESVSSVIISFKAGDVLFGKLRPYLAKAARPDFDGVCTSEILALRPVAECSQSYVMYCLLNAPYIRSLDSLTYGAKMPRVSPEQVSSSFTPVPPPPEQHAIADFLDCETARIDALVAKKERLIELLHEKRTALITHAVTKGLDPNAPMKDSGVEWLGEVPQTWVVGRLKDHGSLIAGAGFPDEYQGVEGKELQFYKVGDLGRAPDDVTMGPAQHTVNHETAQELRAGVVPIESIVYAKIGAALFLNRRRKTSVSCCIDNNMTAFVPKTTKVSTGSLTQVRFPHSVRATRRDCRLWLLPHKNNAPLRLSSATRRRRSMLWWRESGTAANGSRNFAPR